MIFLISLIICIFLHELGHLITAKICKCSVLVFSIGFGKELFSFMYKGTKYRLALIPLGGYNKLEHEIDYCRNKYALPNLTYSKKLFVILAGCFINIATGYLAYYASYHWIINYNLYYFGVISMALGVTNLIPFPALDGSYPFLFLLEKFMPKKRALHITSILVKWGFIILMTLNILFIPYMIKLLIKGAL